MSAIRLSIGIVEFAYRVLVATTLVGYVACQQLSGQALQVGSVSVGIAPLGIDTTAVPTGAYAAVANSGDNSVSILQLTIDPNTQFLTGVVPAAVARPVPSPYAVAGCWSSINLGDRFVVTSPSDNSASIVQIPQGTVVATVRVGAQPRAAACYFDRGGVGRKAVVSNYADNTLSVIDLESATVIAQIAGVPGARGLHGIGIYRNQAGSLFAWVGGTDAGVVTVVDLATFSVLNQIPVRTPTAVVCCFRIASESEGTVAFFAPETPGTGTVQLSGLTRPQDIVESRLGTFVTQGGTSSVASNTTAINGIPDAAALAAYAFTSSPSSAYVLISSTSSNRVYVARQSPATPTQFSMSNGANFSTSGVAPGSLNSAFGSAGVSQPFFATSLPLPTGLGNVSLSIGGTLQPNSSGGFTYSSTGASLAPLLFVGPTQVNFQIPPGIAPGDSVAAQLTKADGTTLLTTVRVTATAPGIFTLLQNGQGQGAVLNQDNSRNGDPAASVVARPAARSSVIQIFATGPGATNPAVAAGAAAGSNPLALTVVQPTVTIGGKPAVVQFSGLAPGFVGLWQINAVIPSDVTPGNAVTLSVSAGGQTSNSVTIAVQ